MAVFFALITFLGWGIGDVFVAIASRRIGNVNTLFWGQILTLIVTTLYIPVAGWPSDWTMFVVSLLLNFLMAYGTLLYFRAFEIGNASLVGTIGGSFLVPVVVFSMIFFGERISFFQITGIIAVTFGLILATLDFKKIRSRQFTDLFSEKGVKYAVLAMLTWGIYYTAVRVPVEKIGWFWGFYPANLFFIVIILLGKLNEKTGKIFQDKKALLAIVFFSFLIMIAQFAYNLGIMHGFTSVVAPIAGSSTVLFVIISRYVFHEKLQLQQKIGIISSLAGIVILAFA